MDTNKKFRRELERQLASWFSQSSLNGFIEIAVGEACSDFHLVVANGEVIHNPHSWIYKTAKNKILDELKQLGYHERIDPFNEHDARLSSESNFEQTEEAILMLEEILPLISDKKRDALLIHEYEGYTLEETAEKLGVSLSAAKKRIREAKSELFEVLRKHI